MKVVLKEEKQKKANPKITSSVILVCMLLIACMLLLSGCRESMALVKVIHDQNAEEVDYNSDQKVVENKENTANLDDKLVKKQETKDSKTTEKKKKIASKQGAKKNEGDANQKKYSKNSPNTDKKVKSSSNKNSTKKNEGKGKNTDKESEEGNTGEGQAGPSKNSREVYDADGNVVELPEKVNSVVAAGDAGIIAQMLGGKGILAGTSASVAYDPFAAAVFDAMGIGESSVFWGDDGSAPMDNSAFEALLEQKPDCCLAFSGSKSFSSGQINKLKQNGIAYVILPSMNTADGIQDAVSTVGDIIGDRTSSGGNNAKDLAKQYKKYCSSLISKVKSKSGGLFTYNNTDYNNDYNKNGRRTASSRNANGKYTLYISGWDPGTFTLSASGNNVFTESGYPITPNGYSRSPLSYFMSVGGVCNYAANLGESNCTTYAALPLVINNLTPSLTGGSTYYRQRNESFASVNLGSENRINLGNSKFDSIVVDSNDTAQMIVNSFMWQFHGRATLDSISDFGFVSDDGSTLIHSYIEGEYNIYVNPAGVVSWTEGSLESVLEAPWAAYRINGRYSESEFRSDVKDFYKTFYNYTLSNSELDAILAGK